MSSLSACRKLHCNSMFFYQILKLLVFRFLQQVEIFYKLLQKGLNILHIFSDTFIHWYNVGLSMHSNVVVVVSINKQQTIAFSTSTIVSCPPTVLSLPSFPFSPFLGCGPFIPLHQQVNSQTFFSASCFQMELKMNPGISTRCRCCLDN